ncbi:hypothetical protein [Legionella pneumophila]|uniref:hypothetical protein n=1 Tax=Legionella pneumophila TaxID=446 RepID=UPI00277C10C7|nr:hypothetical protein [Legionella pneumophila]
MRTHRLEALARNIKFHTRLRDGINASSARTIQDNDLSYPQLTLPHIIDYGTFHVMSLNLPRTHLILHV